MTDEAEAEAYQRELHAAESADLSMLDGKEVIVASRNRDGSLARDSSGAPTIILTPSLLPQSPDAWEKTFQLFLVVTREICDEPYRVVYIHSGFSPPVWFTWWLFGLRARVSRAHRKNINGLTIVHPSIGVRLLFLALRPILGANFWRKLHYADRIEELWLDDVLQESVAKRNISAVVFAYEQKIQQEAEEAREAAILMGAPLSSREAPYSQNQEQGGLDR